jgi:hypothetical protein
MNLAIKFGLAALALEAFSTFSSKAETPDIFTRHELPLPGAYFKNKESQQQATVAVSKSGKGVGQEKQKTSKPEKKQIKRVRPANVGS